MRLAPMIDHEFSTYFMFPDHMGRHMYWFEELQKSIEGRPVQPEEYDYLANETERKLMEMSATCLNKNLLYIREHYPEVTRTFLKKLMNLEEALKTHPEQFEIHSCPDYPNRANSDAYLSGKARYKDHDEEKARLYEEKYGTKSKEINFEIISSQVTYEIKKTIQSMKKVLEN